MESTQAPLHPPFLEMQIPVGPTPLEIQATLYPPLLESHVTLHPPLETQAPVSPLHPEEGDDKDVPRNAMVILLL